MATLEFFTGFEGCGISDDIYSMISAVSSTALVVYSATGGFDDGKCLKIGSYNYYFSKTVSVSKTKAVGFHVNGIGTYAYSSTALQNNLVSFLVGSTQVSVANVSTGIEVHVGNTLVATASGETISNTLHHIEFKLFSNATTGTISMKIDGTPVGFDNTTGLNTDGGDITNITFGTGHAVGAVYYDNIYIADDLCGELKSYLISPTSDSTVAFTPSTGIDNYALVDDTAQDGDTTYVESSTLNHEDLYGYSDIPTDVNVVGYNIVTIARKDDAGARILTNRVHQDATTYDQGAITLTTSYPAASSELSMDVHSLAPDTSALTPTIINALTFGYKVTT